jgi:predicted GIY-YIG superfamily endonuclease
MAYVYCLVSETNPDCTYVGATQRLSRRLRQHNGNISGGARTTRAHRPWKFLFTIHCMNQRQAFQLEHAIKHQRVRGLRGIAGKCVCISFTPLRGVKDIPLNNPIPQTGRITSLETLLPHGPFRNLTIHYHMSYTTFALNNRTKQPIREQDVQRLYSLQARCMQHLD